MIQLQINGEIVTVNPGELIALKKSAIKIGNLSSREGSFTNDFTIPATAENIKALGFASEIGAIGEAVRGNRKIDAVLFQGSMEISRGFVQLISYDYLIRSFKVAFFGGLSDWVTKLGATTIRDIDLSALNHEWTVANVVASFANTDGYIYPLINYGNFVSWNIISDDMEAADFYPAVFLKTILVRAFSEIGYKIGGSFINEFKYKNAIIPFAGKDFLSSIEFENTFKGDMTGNQLYQQTFSTVPQDVDQNLIYTTKNDNEYGNFNVLTNTFEAENTETYRMRLEVDVTNFEITNTGGSGADSSSLSIQAIDSGGATVLAAVEILELTGTGTTSLSGSYVFEFDWTATAGQTLTTQFNFTTDSTTASSVQYIAEFEEYRLFCDGIDRVMAEGDTVEVSYNMPEIEIVDLVRDMVQRNGLVVTTNDYTQTVNFDRFELITTKEANDWTDKVSISGTHELLFQDVTEGYAKRNIFRYADPGEDDTQLNEYDSNNTEPIGQGTIEVDSDYLGEAQEIHISPFKAAIMTDPFQAGTGLYIPYLRRYNDTGLTVEYNPGPRILYVIPNAAIADVTLSTLDQIQIGGVLRDNIAYSFFYKRATGSDYDFLTDSLSYGTINEPNVIESTLIAENYRELTRILNNGKSVELKVQLREDEFVNLDFSNPVLINSGAFRGYFLIDEIKDYRGANELCSVKLIEIADVFTSEI